MYSIQTYLSSVQANRKKASLLILGNEAADLDSMVSSITYGYLLSQQKPDTFVLPVMPIPRCDFQLRTEAVYLFRQAGIVLDDIVFLDEIDFDALMMAGANLVLVDHNKLGLGLEQYNAHVKGIVDHHHDEELYRDAQPRIIQVIGSTASLVGMEYLKAGVTITREIAILLGGTILLDTVNLKEKAGRVTHADVAIAELVLPLCPLPRHEFFDNIQREKFDVTGLSTEDLLRKDYKEYQYKALRCGIAAALLPISQWQEMDQDLFAGLVSCAATRSLDLLLSMNAFFNPGYERNLIVYSTTKEVHDTLIDYLQGNGLELTLLETAGAEGKNSAFVGCYRQGNLGISRKKLQPLLADFYKN